MPASPPKGSGAKGAAANPKGAAARRIIDLDSARAARLELAGEGPVIMWGGAEFQLPPELPVDVMHYTLQGDVRLAVLALFEEDEAEAQRFLTTAPMSFGDFQELMTQLEPAYGIAPGEVRASPRS